MRETFRYCYTPTEEEFDCLWEKCIFVLDANILLNIYRYSPDTRDKLIQILNKVSSRLWIPHQAALEYQKNRLNVIKQQKKAYDEINEVIDENISDIKTGLKRFNRHPFINVRSLIDKIEKVSEEIKQELVDQKKSILT
ncbi:hypothetical protein J2756_001252 [Methanobacterium aggregans]|nr:hypothetical protein [Methanobacterium aggregans]